MGREGADRSSAAPSAGQFGPQSYRDWRASDLGAITEALEERLIFRFAGALAGQAVLDVGCGDGALALAFYERGATRIVGCDVDLRMIMRATARAAEHRAPVAYAMGRAEMLPFRDASFNLVTAITVLAFVPEAERAVHEMARVLKPGGRLVLCDLGKWSQWAVSRRMRSWLGDRMWRHATFRSARQLRFLVEAAGLRIERVEGAVYYPRCAPIARLMAAIDQSLGKLTTVGAAFLAVEATKP